MAGKGFGMVWIEVALGSSAKGLSGKQTHSVRAAVPQGSPSSGGRDLWLSARRERRACEREELDLGKQEGSLAARWKRRGAAGSVSGGARREGRMAAAPKVG